MASIKLLFYEIYRDDPAFEEHRNAASHHPVPERG
jgi:quinol monooxygenase YgiN